MTGPADDPKPRVALLANGRAGGFEEYRAKVLIGRDARPDSSRILLRETGGLASWQQWKGALEAWKPRVVYSINTAFPAVPLALAWARRRRIPFVLDTGDLVYEMARCSGVEAKWKWPFLWAGERLAWRWARTMVVRSTCFQDYLKARGHPNVEVIRDGYHPAPPPPAAAVTALRHSLGLQDSFVVGVLGSLVWSPTLQICYGWDLIEALSRMRVPSVRGLIIGDGDGRARLERRAAELGVRDRVVFTGRIPYDQVPVYLRVFDVALSTQTNNLPGQVRTTGKLPEYMAAARFILASRVGEATRLLPEAMLVDFEGEVDLAYPARLAERIAGLISDPAKLRLATGLPDVAERFCAPAVLQAAFRRVIREARSL